MLWTRQWQPLPARKVVRKLEGEAETQDMWTINMPVISRYFPQTHSTAQTHSSKKGKIKIPNFVVFEAIRPKKGGGTLIAANENLEPKLIEEYNSEFELLVLEIELKEKSIRVISGYGPQETGRKKR